MKVGFVGHVVASGDVPQGVVGFELLDDQFDRGSLIVKAPKIERLQGQIGDEDLVMIATELKTIAVVRWNLPVAGVESPRSVPAVSSRGADSETWQSRRPTPSDGSAARSAGAGWAE